MYIAQQAFCLCWMMGQQTSSFTSPTPAAAPFFMAVSGNILRLHNLPSAHYHIEANPQMLKC